MRGTSHNGRAGKNGTYSPKHNDRNFDVDSAEHIDPDRADDNWYWHRYQSEEPEMTFEQAESKFYEDNFTDSLNAKNERYRASGHKDRMKSMDEYRENRMSCPEETLLQVGKTGKTIDPDLLRRICIEHINWEINTFPNVKVLDVALHADEEGAPHMHERKVWVAHSSDGLIVGQAKALEEMGIDRPHPEKKKDRYNNPKTTYTAMCREHFLEVCKQHGLELELEPDKTSKRGLELEEYKRQQEQEKAEQARQEAEQAKQERDTAERARQVAEQAQRQAEREKEQAENDKKELEKQKTSLEEKNKALMQENDEVWQENEAVKGGNKTLQAENARLNQNNTSLKAQNEELTSQNAQKQRELNSVKENITEAQNTLKKANTALQQVQDKSEELQSITAQVETANKQLEQVLDMKARASEIHKVFGDKETQTYHKNMLESTRAIGHEAYEHMQDAQTRERRTAQRERQLDDRELKIHNKETDIEPLYAEARKTRAEAREYRDNIKSYIMGTAKNMIKNELIPEKDKLSDKMRDFMSNYNIRGKSLDKIFDEQQERERQRMQAELEEKARRIVKSRDDWDLEL